MAHGSEQPKPTAPESLAAGYEVHDADPRPIVIFAIGLIITIVITQFISWSVMRVLDQTHAADNARDFPANPLTGIMPVNPPEPRLEPESAHDSLPKADLADVQARERAMIGPDAWQWVDASHRFARIPLGQAIDLAVNKGLPNVLPTTQPAQRTFMPPASTLHGPGGAP